MSDPVCYAFLSGTLLAHLKFALHDLEAVLRAIPRSNTPARGRIEERITIIRGTLARHPWVHANGEDSDPTLAPPESITEQAPAHVNALPPADVEPGGST